MHNVGSGDDVLPPPSLFITTVKSLQTNEWIPFQQKYLPHSLPMINLSKVSHKIKMFFKKPQLFMLNHLSIYIK